MMIELGELVEALNCSMVAWRRDECGDWRIEGKNGWIYEQPEGVYLFCDPGSVRGWNIVKDEFGKFCKLTQEGDDEGAFKMTALPSREEAEVVLRRLGIRRRKKLTEAGLAHLREMRLKSPLKGLGSKRSA